MSHCAINSHIKVSYDQSVNYTAIPHSGQCTVCLPAEDFMNIVDFMMIHNTQDLFSSFSFSPHWISGAQPKDPSVPWSPLLPVTSSHDFSVWLVGRDLVVSNLFRFKNYGGHCALGNLKSSRKCFFSSFFSFFLL